MSANFKDILTSQLQITTIFKAQWLKIGLSKFLFSKKLTFTETGNWSGMISNLVNGEADVMTTSLTLCCGRTNAVDYLWSLSFSTAGLLIKGKVNY